MANRKKAKNNESQPSFKTVTPYQETINMNELEKMYDSALHNMTTDEKEEFEAMFYLAMSGVTPEKYADFYDFFQMTVPIANNLFPKEEEKDGFMPEPYDQLDFKRSWSTIKEYEPLEQAAESTLALRIQMKDVKKPPMWREVEIPADFVFSQLHEVIQTVTGLEDCHLWQFNVKAYDDTLLIGLNDGRMVEITHDAEETPVTQFLQHKGDKLEYVYDFGDDWIFSIEVKDLIDKKSEKAVCRKFKSELNAIDDFGGVWNYLSARESLENWGTLTKKEQKKYADTLGFDSPSEYLKFLNEHRFSLDNTNEALELI